MTDWKRAADDFRRREYVTLHDSLPPEIDTESLWLLFEHASDPESLASGAQVVKHALYHAHATGTLTEVAAYIYAMCQTRWEHSIEHPPILGVVRAATKAWADSRQGFGVAALSEPGLLLQLAASLRNCMAVEVALNSSTPVRMAVEASAAASSARALLSKLEQIPTTEAELFIRQVAEAQAIYFEAVRATAEAVTVFISDRVAAEPLLHSAIAQVREAEDHPSVNGDVYESELRAHRATLETMTRLVCRPEVRVVAGRVYYLYPFTVLGMSAGALLEAGLTVGRSATIGTSAVVDTGPLEITDAWDCSDPDGRRHGGTRVTLQTVTIVDGDGHSWMHDVDLVFTRFGSCYVKVSTELCDCGPHLLSQFLRRGSVHMGEETVCDAGSTFPRLSAYVTQLIEALEGKLRAGAPSAQVVSNLQRRLHTVLSIQELAVQKAPGHPPTPAQYEDLRDAVGFSLLLGQRVDHASSTLEDYVRRDASEPMTVLRDVGFRGEVLVRSSEASVLIMPMSANFVALYYEDLIEFSATLPTLLDQWTTAIYRQRKALAALLVRHDSGRSAASGPSDPDAHGTTDMMRLEQEQLELQRLITDARSMLAFVKSPSLCATAHLRASLDVLLLAAGLPALEDDLHAQIEEVEGLYERVRTLARRYELQQQMRYRRLVEVALGFLAVSSLSGLFSLLNEGTAVDYVYLEVVAIIVLSAIFSVVTLRSRHDDEN